MSMSRSSVVVLVLALFFLQLLFGDVSGTASGTVVVSDGNTLKVHSDPSTSASTLYSLSNGAAVSLECYMKGTSVSGSQGTSDQWDQIKSSTYGTGYASHAYIKSSGTLFLCGGSGVVSGKVVVSSGSTLNVHSAPSTSSSTIYSLNNGQSVNITCQTTGDSVSGSQGTTNKWYQISSNGYATAAYMTSSGTAATCTSPTPSSDGWNLANALAFADATWDCGGGSPPCETCSSRVSSGTGQSPYGCAPYVAHILSAGGVNTGCGKCGSEDCYSSVYYSGKYYDLNVVGSKDSLCGGLCLMDYLLAKGWVDVGKSIDAGVVCAVDGGSNFDNPWGHIVFGVAPGKYDAHNVARYHNSFDVYSGHVRQCLRHP